MTASIPLHPDDLDTVLRHMLEVEQVATDRETWIDDLPEEERADWRRWTEAACAGAPPRACNIGEVAWVAARGMARVLAERRKDQARDEEIALGFTPESR